MAKARSKKYTDKEISSLASIPDEILKAQNQINDNDRIAIFIETEKLIKQEIHDLKQLNLINSDQALIARLVEIFKREIINFENSINQDQIENKIKFEFRKLLKVNPNNNFLKVIEMHFLLHTPLPNEEKSDEPNNSLNIVKSLHKAIVIAMEQTFNEDLDFRYKIPLAQEFYKKIMIYFIQNQMMKKFRNEYKKITGNEINEDYVHEDVKIHTNALSSKLFSGRENFSVSVAHDLNTLTHTKFKFKNKSFYLLTSAEAKQLIAVEEILLGRYKTFEDFEKAISSLGSSHHSEDSLFSYLPLLAKPDNPFPSISDQSIKSYFFNIFKEYLIRLRDVNIKKGDERLLQNFAETAFSGIQELINCNFEKSNVERFFSTLTVQFQFNLPTKLKETIIELFLILRDRKNVPDLFAGHPLLNEREFPSVLEFIKYLYDYQLENNPRHAELKSHLDHVIERLSLQLSEPLKQIIKDPNKVNEYLYKVNQIDKLNEDLNKAIAGQQVSRGEQLLKFDLPRINLLRAQVLHAAKEYFNPVKASFMSMFHHTESGKVRVFKLLDQLFKPQLINFSDAAILLSKFLSEDKNESGLHTNSFDTILLQILYNQGHPQGFFSLTNDELSHLEISDIYPNFTQDLRFFDFSYKKISDENTAQVKKLLNEYNVPNLQVEGEVSNMLRGVDRVTPSQRNLIRQQAANNFKRMVKLVEESKPDSALEVAPVPQQIPASANRRNT